MLVVGAIVAFMIQIVLSSAGLPLTYVDALIAVLTLKALALFLVPEKAPIVLMKTAEYEEE